MNFQKFTTFKTILIALVLIISTNQLFAQTSDGIFFQAVARDNFSNPAKDRKIYVQSSIIQTTPTGTKILTEEHQVNTDGAGMFSISIGNGTRVGGTASGLNAIDWSQGPFFLNLKIAITPVASSVSWDYTKEWVNIGTTSFGAVPFALYSANAGGVNQKLNITDTTKMLSGYAKTQAVQSLTSTVSTKLSLSDTASMLNPYARASLVLDSAYINTQLKSKANTTDVNTSLATKVDKVTGKDLSTNDYTNAEKTKLAAITGANTGDQDLSALATNTALALKANTTDVNTALNLKANTVDVSTSLDLKANTADVNTSLATKVDKVTGKDLSTNDYTTVEKTKLAAITGTNTGDQDLSALATNTALALKANTTDVNTALNLKANTADVSSSLNLKANTTDVNTSLATKVDKVTGKDLSTNDFTTAEKTKLAAITGTNTGDQDLSALATNTSLATKVDKVTGKDLSTNDYTTVEKTKLAAITGTNTGDQDLSAFATTANVTTSLALKANTSDVTISLGLKANTADVTSDLTLKFNKVDTSYLLQKSDTSTLSNRINLKANAADVTTSLNLKANTTDVTTSLATKVDKVTGKDLSTNDYTTLEKTKLAAITGTNTGDQDLSALATTASVTTALALKANTSDVNTSLGLKANTTDVTTALNLKANTTDVTTSLATKVDKVTGKDLSTNDYTTLEKTKLAAITGTNTGDQDLSALATNTALSLKANTTDVNTSLGLKANITDMESALNLKANTTDINTSLATKVDKVTGKDLSTNDYTTLEKTKLAAITGTNTGDQDLSALATTANVTTALALKANTSDVNTSLGLKANTADVTTSLNLKANAADVTTSLNLKANTTDINTSLATKVDKVTGKELSTNDYTTAEKTKLAAITGTNTGDQTDITGNAATATKLATAKNINGVAFDGSADITVTADAGTLTGTTLASNVVNSSLTSVGTLTSGTISLTTNIATSGTLKAGAITYPNTAGTNGQVLTSNGAGNASWISPTTVSVGTISSTSNANGATITSGVLSLTPADETNGGIVTNGTQTFAGLKTFKDGINYIKVSSSPTLDQSNISRNASTSGTSLWQSFTAGVNGILSSVEWQMSSPLSPASAAPVTVKIYNGEGTSGTLLGTANGMSPSTTISNPSFVAFDLSSSNIKVIAGQLYTIQLTTTIAQSTFLTLNSANAYSNGRASLGATLDYIFKTYVKATSTDSYLPLSGGSLTGNLSTSGTLTAGDVTYPNSHGTRGQVLSTTGSGTLTWTNSTAPANETNGGIVSTGTQTFAGLKTFNDGINYIKVNSSPALDQSSTDVNGGAGGTSQWQSFTAGVNGILSSVEWNMGSPLNSATAASVTVKIYDGEGTNGTLLGTSNGMTPATNNFNAFEYVAFDLSNSNIKVIAGQRYTIQLTTSTVPNAFLSLSYSNPYANGRSSFDPNWDFLFKTYVKATSTDSYLPLSGGSLTGNLSTSGTLTAGDVTYPNAHGTRGQVLSTTGSGTLTWTNSTVDAGTLTGTTLNSSVTGSSLTSVGTLNSATVNGKVIVGASSAATASAVLEVSSTTQGFLPPRMSGAQRDAISSKVAGLVVWCSNCGSKGELQVYNGTEWTNIIGGTASVPIVVGAAYQGGIIAYILQNGDPGYDANIPHGLIAATSNQSNGVVWGPNYTTTGATGTIIGTGLSNTDAIIASQGSSTSYAARLARSYTGGGYNDWYLPSRDELYKLYLNRVQIGGSIVGTYWSSSEYGQNESYTQNFDNGDQLYWLLKSSTYSVRAIRAF